MLVADFEWVKWCNNDLGDTAKFQVSPFSIEIII